MRRPTPLSEASMQSAESNIPRLATQAGRAAHQRALSQTGHVVMKSSSGQLVKQQSNGVEVLIKTLPSSTPAQAGMVLKRAKKLPLKAATGR